MNLHDLDLQNIDLQTMIGLTGISLLLAASVLRLLLLFKVNKLTGHFIALIVFALSYLSISGDSVNFYLRGIFNDLSISSLILLSYFFISSDKPLLTETSHTNIPLISNHQTYPIFFFITITGLFFYPAALGLGAIDPYAWGFISKTHHHSSALIFIICLAALMFFSLLKQYRLLLLCLVLSTLAYQFKILESQNLWDYLFDPLIFVYAFITVINQLNKKFNPF